MGVPEFVLFAGVIAFASGSGTFFGAAAGAVVVRTAFEPLGADASGVGGAEVSVGFGGSEGAAAVRGAAGDIVELVGVDVG